MISRRPRGAQLGHALHQAAHDVEHVVVVVVVQDDRPRRQDLRLRLVPMSGSMSVGSRSRSSARLPCHSAQMLRVMRRMAEPCGRRCWQSPSVRRRWPRRSTGLPRIREQADCVELRLDLLRGAVRPAGPAARARRPARWCATLRPPDQGGQSPLPRRRSADDPDRGGELGAEFVDLEWDAASAEAHGRGCERRAHG